MASYLVLHRLMWVLDKNGTQVLITKGLRKMLSKLNKAVETSLKRRCWQKHFLKNPYFPRMKLAFQ